MQGTYDQFLQSKGTPRKIVCCVVQDPKPNKRICEKRYFVYNTGKYTLEFASYKIFLLSLGVLCLQRNKVNSGK